ncbi:hypothetical protein C0J52_13718 [Blattella germanica]|nr:hypothetical protein C0J52_13718 [Blattella germanica]
MCGVIFKKTASKIRKWNETNMKMAVDGMLAGTFSLREAAARFCVPKSTLSDRVCALRMGKFIEIAPSLGRFKETFDKDLEDELVSYLKYLDSCFLPVNKSELLKLVYDLAEHFKLPHQFNKAKKTAGDSFYRRFIIRHPEFSFRFARSTNQQRDQDFNQDAFFDKLEELTNKFSFSPNKIFHCDETVVSIVHSKSQKMSIKGKKRLNNSLTGECSRNIRVMLCANATGEQFIPPLFVFPRIQMDQQLMKEAPEGSVFDVEESGQISLSGFIKWLKAFVKRVNPTEQNPVLLVLNGHSIHKTLETLLFCIEHDIHILSLPRSTAHDLLPLDHAIIGIFKSAYYEAFDEWMNDYGKLGFKITDKDICKFVGTAFTKICVNTPPKRKQWDPENMSKAISDVRNKKMGYLKASKLYNVPHTTLRRLIKSKLPLKDAVSQKLGRKVVLGSKLEEELVSYLLVMEKQFFGLTRKDVRQMAYQLAAQNGLAHPFLKECAGKGIYPLNPNVFSEEDFIATAVEASVTSSNNPMPNVSIHSPEVNDGAGPSTATTPNVSTRSLQIADGAGPSAATMPNVSTHSLQITDRPGPSTVNVTPWDISPVPKIVKRMGTRGRKAGSAAILTSSPYKNELINYLQQQTIKAAQKKLSFPNKSCSSKEIKNSRLTTNQKRKQNKKNIELIDSEEGDEVMSIRDDSSDISSVENPEKVDCDATCMFCEGKFLSDIHGKEWVMCISCCMWAHSECAGLEKGSYVCDFCK